MKRRSNINYGLLYKKTFGFKPYGQVKLSKTNNSRAGKTITLDVIGIDCLKAANKSTACGKEIIIKDKSMTVHEVGFNVNKGEIRIVLRKKK